MRIIISGASGLIGNALSIVLEVEGHDVIPLIRAKASYEGRGIVWNPNTGFDDPNVLEGLDDPDEWPTYIWGVDSLLGGYGLHNFISRCIGYMEGNTIIAEIVMDEVYFESEEF